MQFCEDYSSFFISQGRNRTTHARQYLTGLLGDIRRKNIERIGEEVAEVDYQSVHNFVSEANWDFRALVSQVAKDANTLLGANPESMLLLDETSFLKKGTHSVGVSRQYCGSSGKVDNGQVAVLGALGCGSEVTLVDYRLYLPETWTGDAARLQRAKVPKDNQVFKTKLELAWDIVETAQDNGLEFSWVGMDSLYGSDQKLLNKLEGENLRYVADVRANQKFYIQCPEGTLQHLRADKIWLNYGAQLAQSVSFRNASKGVLKAQVMVVPLHPCEAQAMHRSLIISCDSTGAIKYSVTNATGTAQQHCYRQHQRYWIERAIQEAKSEVGMDQYQVRGWNGWHQHMAMVSLAMLFALQQKMIHREKLPLLSTHDIVELLSFYLPTKKKSEEEIFNQMTARHRARLRSIQYHYKNRKIPEFISLTM